MAALFGGREMCTQRFEVLKDGEDVFLFILIFSL